MNSINANIRTDKTKGELNFLRNNGNVPAIIYGGNEKNEKIYVSKRLTGKDVPIIDPKNEGKSLKDKFMRLMQTKVF